MKNIEKDANIAHKNKDNIVTLYVTRHGKTILNTNKRVQGWADSPLVEKGVEIAKGLGNGLQDIPFVDAYSSDSGRAIETAHLVLKYSGQSKLQLEQRKGLRELNFGIFEGDMIENMWETIKKIAGVKEVTELMNFSIKEIMNFIVKADSTKQAENWDVFSIRIKKEIDTISEDAARNGGGNVLVVAHGLMIATLVEMLDSSKTRMGVQNASVTKIVYQGGEYKIESVGDMSYAEKGSEIIKS
ncbi:histidine phosphatase family protein [Bacillus cereus]|uniref:histidine phosphatase family protein n=1 Tax=Bacillus cereus group TaxID=86661 RepID=UPI000BF5CFB3|nr:MULTISPECIES: histidine phosphatase family protein [Bacillus cereus group]PFO78888.1 histidine phosphatase family protein [Bacillus cereus]PFR19565.1 histidine phosphatase family protein [Bacillus cereus]